MIFYTWLMVTITRLGQTKQTNNQLSGMEWRSKILCSSKWLPLSSAINSRECLLRRHTWCSNTLLRITRIAKKTEQILFFLWSKYIQNKYLHFQWKKNVKYICRASHLAQPCIERLRINQCKPLVVCWIIVHRPPI